MPKKICLLLLIGIPGSGKTTFALNLCERFVENYNIINLNYDRLVNITEICKEKGIYNLFRKNILNLTETIIMDILFNDNKRVELIKTTFNSDLEINLFDNDKPYVIILDDNMHLRSMRYNYYKLAKSLNLSYMQIFFNIDLKLALTRNNNRKEASVIPDVIVKRMFISLKKPFPKINKWENNSIIIDSVEIDVLQINEFILKCLCNPEIPTECKEPHLHSCDQSRIHQIDQLLRKEISNSVKKNKDLGVENIQMYAELLNAKRKQILNDVKQNIILDSENVLKFLE